MNKRRPNLNGRKCTFPGCDSPHCAKGLCHRCYTRLAYQKNPEKHRNRTKKSYKENPVQAAARRFKRNRSISGKYGALIANAKTRGIPVSITKEEYQKVCALPCHYCRGPLPEAGHGLDRLNNNLGYHLNNVVPCCTTCNKARGTWWTPEETRIAVQAVEQYRLSLNEPQAPLKIIKS